MFLTRMNAWKSLTNDLPVKAELLQTSADLSADRSTSPDSSCKWTLRQNATRLSFRLRRRRPKTLLNNPPFIDLAAIDFMSCLCVALEKLIP